MDLENAWLVCVPAYGRKLKTQKDIKAYFEDGKDFMIVGVNPGGGRYVNKKEVDKYNLTLEVRYGDNYEKLFAISSI